MNRKITWALVALVLIAAPAVLGLALLGSDDGDRRAGSLTLAAKNVANDHLVIPGVTPPNQGIEVMSFSWGVSNASSGAASLGGAVAGKATFQDLTITTLADELSPKMIESVAVGTHIPVMTLSVQKGGAIPANVMTYEFSGVLVSSISHSKGGGDAAAPSEQISFNYAKFKIVANKIDPKGGVTAGGQFGWDLAANKKI